MKVKIYQLKIAVKNVKPPIWWWCTVPSGITFSQLGVLLNEIMGRKARASFWFEFYQRGVRVREDDGAKAYRPTWKYSLAEATETYIDEYLDQEKWFSYNLEGDDHHRVTVEKIFEAENKEEVNAVLCPCVLKYKGTIPMRQAEAADLSEYSQMSLFELALPGRVDARESLERGMESADTWRCLEYDLERVNVTLRAWTR